MRLTAAHIMTASVTLILGCRSDPPFYGLHADAKIEETASMNESPSQYWWVNSGGYLFITNRIGSTIQGELSPANRWYRLYNRNNPEDTDNGSHPQNIFRLITRKSWTNMHELAYFRLNRYNLSDSPQRAGDNGLLLFLRYSDNDNLYYAGIRVDGKAVIKRKQRARYKTLSEISLFPGTFNHESNPNLIPTNVWIGIYTSVTNTPDGSSHIVLAVDKGPDSGGFKIVSEIIDKPDETGTPIPSGHGGIRTDFMNVEFRSFLVNESVGVLDNQ